MKNRMLKNESGAILMKLILLVIITVLAVFIADQWILVPEEDFELAEAKERPETFHYYYNQLDENAKLIYRGIESNMENMKTGNYEINFGRRFDELLNSENGDQKISTVFQTSWNAYTYDHPEIFYIDITKLMLTTKTTSILVLKWHDVNLSGTEDGSYYTDKIESEEDVKTKIAYVTAERERILSNVKGKTDYQKIKYIHDWLVDNLSYYTGYTGKEDNDVYNIYGALKNHRVVCEGYARTFKFLLDGVNIENVLVSGKATNTDGNTESHAWNYVKLNNKWYAVDTTWDDPIIIGNGSLTDTIKYKNFLKGSKTFFKNHTEKGELSDNSMKFEFPVLESKDY